MDNRKQLSPEQRAGKFIDSLQKLIDNRHRIDPAQVRQTTQEIRAMTERLKSQRASR
jgi:hypothetical protein